MFVCYAVFVYRSPLLYLSMSSMYMISKSLFTNEVRSGNQRLIYNPAYFDPIQSSAIPRKVVLQEIAEVVKTIIETVYVDRYIVSEDLQLIRDGYLDVLRRIESEYGAHASSQNYENISRDHAVYVDLYDQMTTLQSLVNEETLNLLLTLAKETLITSFHAVNLHSDNLSLLVQKSQLQSQVTQLIEEANRSLVEVAENNNTQMTLTRTFTLAPVYSYYISVYGMPVNGAGFNPLKISFLAEILTNLGISPY